LKQCAYTAEAFVDGFGVGDAQPHHGL
jgi:hypothetical protein